MIAGENAVYSSPGAPIRLISKAALKPSPRIKIAADTPPPATAPADASPAPAPSTTPAPAAPAPTDANPTPTPAPSDANPTPSPAPADSTGAAADNGAAGADQSGEGEFQAPAATGKIAKITISGNKNISTDAIMAVMTEKVGDQYSQTAAENDREAIKDMGYFNGEVGITVTNDPAGGLDINYSVTENPIVKKIVFTANTPNGIPSIAPDVLMSKMDTKEGQVLNSNVFKRDLEKLFDRQTGFAREKGFIMDPSQDLNLDPDTDVLTIPIIEAHIDHIIIKGNKKTKSIVITREMHSKPGDVLNEIRLQKDLTAIYNLGLFDQVGPFEETPTDIGKVDITIPVVEKRSGQVSVGVGYSSTEKLVGRAELAENNFRGMGERVAIMWEVDGLDTGSSVDLSFFEPYIDKHHTSMDVDLFDRAVYRFESDTFGTTNLVGSNNVYIEQHKGVSFGFHRPISDTISEGLSLRQETITVNNVELPPQDLYIRQQGPVSAVQFELSQNTRDNNFSPASGGLRSISLELGTSDTTTVDNTPGPLIPGVHNFAKFGLDLRQYISLQGPRKAGDFREPKKVFAIRFLVGFTNSQIPFSQQYFIGGPDSVRSLQIDQFWGNNLALAQAELRIPIGKDNNLQGVLFTDMGDAWGSIYQDSQLQQHTNFDPATDVGVGVRLVTPVGPIRLDYGVGTGGARTQFDIGQSF